MPFKNKEKQKAYQKAYREANKEKKKAYQKAYYLTNKEKLAKRQKAYREANKEKQKAYYKAYYEANEEKKKAYHKAYYLTNKEKLAKRRKLYERQRRAKDPIFKLRHSYSTSCRRAFQSISQKKNNKSLKLLGLKTWQELAKHFESQFYDHPETGEEMTFDNHGFYGWHIDHIIPLDSAKTEGEIIKLCHYTNLQPMWAEENFAKSNKILDTQ